MSDQKEKLSDFINLIKEDSCGYCPQDGIRITTRVKHVILAADMMAYDVDYANRCIETKYGPLDVWCDIDKYYSLQIEKLLVPERDDFIKAAQTWINKAQFLGIQYDKPVKTITGIPHFTSECLARDAVAEYRFAWPTEKEYIGLYFLYGTNVSIGYKRYHLHGN